MFADRSRLLALPATLLMLVGTVAIFGGASWGSWAVLAGTPLMMVYCVVELVWLHRAKRHLDELRRQIDDGIDAGVLSLGDQPQMGDGAA